MIKKLDIVKTFIQPSIIRNDDALNLLTLNLNYQYNIFVSTLMVWNLGVYFEVPAFWNWDSVSRGRTLWWWWCLTLVIPWTVAPQAPLSMGFSRQECWSRLPFSSPGDLPNPGIKPGALALQTDSLPTELWGKTQDTGIWEFKHRF